MRAGWRSLDTMTDQGAPDGLVLLRIGDPYGDAVDLQKSVNRPKIRGKMMTKMKPNRSLPLRIGRGEPVRAAAHLSRVCLLLLLLCGSSTSLLAQGFFARDVVLEGVHVPRPDGTVAEGVNIVLRQGRIQAIGSDAEGNMMSRKPKVSGLYATAGLTDLSSTLTLTPTSKGSAIQRAWDGFDRFDSKQILKVLASGITRVHLVPTGSGGIVGRVTSVSLQERDNGGFGKPSDDDVALHIDLSVGGPIQRIRTYESLRKEFISARDLRDQSDDYSDDLEEYLEALKEAAEKKEKEGEEGEEGEGEKADESEKDGDAEEEKGPEKPGRPGRNPAGDLVLKALDHDLPVLITARRSEDLQNAIDLIEEFQLKAIIHGADEAHLLLEELQGLEDVELLLDGGSGQFQRGATPRHDPSLMSRLDEAEIPWSLGSGGMSTSLWRVLQQRAGADPDTNPLQLGIRQGRQGRAGGWLRRGSNEIVLWSGNPAVDPTARPERVIINGKVLWQRPAGTREGSF